jgi:hypothetical protein
MWIIRFMIFVLGICIGSGVTKVYYKSEKCKHGNITSELRPVRGRDTVEHILDSCSDCGRILTIYKTRS